MAIVTYPQPSTGSRALHDMTPNQLIYGTNTSISINPSSYVDILTITGSGVLAQFYISFVLSTGAAYAGVSMLIDGNETHLYSTTGSTAIAPLLYGSSTSSSGGNSSIRHSEGLYKFTTGIAIRVRNLQTSSSGFIASTTIQGVYYT